MIFCSPGPLKVKDISQCLSEMFDAELQNEDIDKAIRELTEQYSSEQYAFEVIQTGNGYQFLTKPAYQASISILLKNQSKKRLSNSSMETLSIIAYKQPITKSNIENIRGVNCDYAIQKLLEKQLIEIKGKGDSIGRPIIYGTSEKFMEYFGINDLKELPTIKDFETEENSIGAEEIQTQ